MARRTIKSMLAAVLLCLVMIPATALAAENAPTTLYVGNYQITNGNATTYLKAGSTQGSLVEGSENDWTVKYDPSTATLTLNGATITGNDNISSVPYGAGIYAQCNSGQPVTLTIELIGENTITGNFGIYVNAEMSANSYGTDASLNITGNGSLIVTGTNSYGLFVKSGTGNASLTINDASVVANTTSTYSSFAGICVQSGASATSSPNLFLAVDGGSLTASGTGNSDGIRLNVGSSQATGATTSLTVTDNAIVRAKNGIKAERVDEPTPSGTGIVFDGGEGTVYGSVTLQENLGIGEGESLKLDDGASLSADGHNVIVGGGTVDESIKNSLGDSVRYTPTITTTNLPNGTVSTSYNQTLAADGSTPITWSIESGGTLPAGLKLENGVISGTPTAEGSSTFTVTATNAYGSDSKQLGISIDAQANVPVADVSLNKTELTLIEDNSEALIATIAPANATNQNVTWSSDKPDVATVENGKVTAVAPGTATITVTTEDGGKTATCAVTVNAKTYDISASPTELSFGSVYVGYAQPAAKTVTVTNKGNQTVTLTLPTSASYEIGKLSAAKLKPNGTATFTVQPKLGLGVGTYAETLTISGLDGDVATVSLSFSVSSRPYIPPTPSGPDWDDVTGDIASAEVGGRVVVGMDSETVLPGEVLEALAGHDVTLVLEMGDGVAWEIYGGDVPEGTSLSDVDMGVELGTSGIPVDVVDLVTGEAGSTQVTLAHEGPFGFELTLVAPVGEKYEGLFANAYRYDAAAGVLRYEAAGVVGDGVARLRLDHASSWLLALDSRSHALPFTDAAEGEWYSEAVRWAWLHGVMTGYADGSGLFGTGDELTRAQMAAVLHNAAGRPDVEASGLPADCDASAWYAQAVAWALSEGVFHGYGDGSAFGPDDPLTREQAACVLHNAAGGPASGSDLSSFSDSGEVSEWAEAAVEWAVAEGVLHGHDGLLEPARALTRAEAAALMANLAARD